MNNYGAPYDYDYMNSIYGLMTPSSTHLMDNELAQYFKKYLLPKAMSVFKFTLPESWSRNYFMYSLFGIGFIAIIETDKFGVIPQHCGLMGRNIFYEPSGVTIANPLLSGVINPTIDEQCTVIKLQPNYSSIMDIVDQHAGMMALAWQTAQMNLVNSKVSYVAFASNKAEAESFKKLHDDIISGKPSVVIDEGLKKKQGPNAGKPNWQLFDQNVGANYIVDKLLDDLNTIENKFKTMVGINNANTDKKERLVVAEVESNNQEIDSLAGLWLEEMQKGFEKTRKMFGFSESELAVTFKKEDEAAEVMEGEGY